MNNPTLEKTNSPERPWYQIETSEALARLNVDPTRGLNEAEAQLRLAQYGPNELIDRGARSPWQILLGQLKGTMTMILIVAAVISMFLKEYEDGFAILAIVVLNTILGFTQEYRAEKSMAALKKMSVPQVRVRREGQVSEISSTAIVPGDIVLLEAGNTVPADGRMIESARLRVQESMLTGESEPVEKQTEALNGQDLPLGDQVNRVFMGTSVTYGRGTVVITETGMQTELGKIATMLQTVEKEETPLQRRLDQVGRFMGYAAVVIVIIVFALGLLRSEEPRLLFLTAISMAVAAVPEGLQTVVTISLSLGAQRMLKRNALIRKLTAVETLGSVTVVCSDKTGTLTENRMTVTVLEVAGCDLELTESGKFITGLPEKACVGVKPLLAGAALCNDAVLQPASNGTEPPAVQGSSTFAAIQPVIQGDPTETALVEAALRYGLDKNELERILPRVAELPFDSDRKRMTTVHLLDPNWPIPQSLKSLVRGIGMESNYLILTKGAVDSLLEVCSHAWVEDHAEPLDAAWRERILAANNGHAQNGIRVLGVAFKTESFETAELVDESLEQDLTFLGLIGMIDLARPEAHDAVRTAHTAGIKTVMITGDHPLTAAHIARDLDIAKDGDRTMTGQELARLSVEELESQAEYVSVYARVSPEHKLKIVQALQEKNHIVAMTGDGVNDAPALKKADIGVAMGITGTDVAKESADMVLLDDNFATIIYAVEEGRRIYANILKFLKYALASNTGELLVMLIAPFLGMPLPLLPLQILWINLVTDGLPGLALTYEPAEPDSMRRPPRNPNESIFANNMGVDIIWIGILLAITSLGMGFWAWRVGDIHWQTMIFTTLTLAQMGNVMALRSDTQTLGELGLLSNKPLLGSVILTFALQMAVIYVPFLQGVFHTYPLPAGDLAISLGVSLIVFFAVELVKVIRRRSVK
ncbi:MAG TPA: cation-translocating P-type ATPase [Anaerolineaceae bacterium]|nr:cation-translocating P-type ATPase [Anaerolineaceae bacterium]